MLANSPSHSPSPTFSASSSPSASFHAPPRQYNASCRSSTSSAASPRIFAPAASRRVDAPVAAAAPSPVPKRQTSDAATQYTPTDYPPTFHPPQAKRQSSASADPLHVSRAKRRETSADTDTTTADPPEPQPRASPQHAPASSAQDAQPPPPQLSAAPKVMPIKYETCDVKDLGVLISDMLMELVRLNDGLPLQDGQLTRFHSRAPPSISVRDYLNRLIVHSTLSPPVLLSMSYVHRFLIAAATVASKGLSDSFWTNNTYARVGGVSTRELALLELEFLTRLEWKIVPKPEVLVDYYRSLVERGEGYVLEQEEVT